MQILGIDPGLGITGYGLIEAKSGTFRLVEAGVIRTDAKRPLSQRLKTIYEGISELIDEYKPQVLVLEKLYSHYKHPTTVIFMGHVRGVVCLAAEERRLAVVGYANTRINKAIIGQGHATKEQIGRMVQHILNLKETPKPFDVSDALALAIGHAQMERRSR